MRLKLYRAPAMAQAMAQVRAELGEDALILATRRVGDGVEVTAALEPDDQPPPPLPPLPPDPARLAALDFHGVPAALRAALQHGELETALAEAIPFGSLPLGKAAAAAGRPAGRRQDTDRRPSGHTPGDGRRPADGDHRRRQACRRHRAACRLHQAARHQPDRRQSSRHSRPRADPPPEQRAGAGRYAGLRSVRSPPKWRNWPRSPRPPAAPWCWCCPPASTRPKRPIRRSAYAAAGARLLVATRLDLARRLGGILAAAGSGLALTEAGIGPGAADGLLPITPAWLAARLLTGLPS